MILAVFADQLPIVKYAAARGADNWDEYTSLALRLGRRLINDFLYQCMEQQLSKN
jgi:hypothetical protein